VVIRAAQAGSVALVLGERQRQDRHRLAAHDDETTLIDPDRTAARGTHKPPVTHGCRRTTPPRHGDHRYFSAKLAHRRSPDRQPFPCPTWSRSRAVSERKDGWKIRPDGLDAPAILTNASAIAPRYEARSNACDAKRPS
jgi:hypothetical protein